MIPRIYLSPLREQLIQSSKIILLFGPRQVGKTTLAQTVLKDFEGRVLEINADERTFRDVLSSQDLHRMKGLVGGYDLLFIDEAQRIPDVGINLKILHDGIPNLKLLVTGSSSFELAQRTREALTGRTWTYIMLPIAITELAKQNNDFELKRQLEEHMVFGMYPEVFAQPNHQMKQRYLQELTSAYLYKDVLDLANLRHPDKLYDLLRLLAYQIGNEVSTNELGRQLSMSKDTVENYISLLEQAFVIFRLRGFSRNLRKEVTKMNKVYFYDLGVRNTLIGDFNMLTSRPDVGKLWENFLIVERKKRLTYNFDFTNTYFWRTYSQAELDYVEEGGGRLAGYEFKYQPRKINPPQSWLQTYPNASFECISPDNYLDFVK
ncbi:MAG: ATP-binding protein [Bacteroidia bacterium]|nr:ATP-binding protein [Bacteroidia bacterium]